MALLVKNLSLSSPGGNLPLRGRYRFRISLRPNGLATICSIFSIPSRKQSSLLALGGNRNLQFQYPNWIFYFASLIKYLNRASIPSRKQSSLLALGHII